MGWLSDLLGGGRRRRDEQAAAAVDEARRVAALRDGIVVHVSRVQHVSPKGTKAWVTVEHWGGEQDTFFWNHRATVGETLAIRPRRGYGPHTNRADVLYVRAEDVLALLPAGVAAAAARHERRTQR